MPVPLVQYYRGLERVGSWVPGGSVGRDQLAMAAKVRRHWFNPCRLGSRGHLGANFSLLLYTDLIKKRKPSRNRYIVHTTAIFVYTANNKINICARNSKFIMVGDIYRRDQLCCHDASRRPASSAAGT